MNVSFPWGCPSATSYWCRWGRCKHRGFEHPTPERPTVGTCETRTFRKYLKIKTIVIICYHHHYCYIFWRWKWKGLKKNSTQKTTAVSFFRHNFNVLNLKTFLNLQSMNSQRGLVTAIENSVIRHKGVIQVRNQISNYRREVDTRWAESRFRVRESRRWCRRRWWPTSSPWTSDSWSWWRSGSPARRRRRRKPSRNPWSRPWSYHQPENNCYFIVHS